MMVGKCRNGMRRVELRGLCLADSRQNCRGDECEAKTHTTPTPEKPLYLTGAA